MGGGARAEMKSNAGEKKRGDDVIGTRIGPRGPRGNDDGSRRMMAWVGMGGIVVCGRGRVLGVRCNYSIHTTAAQV